MKGSRARFARRLALIVAAGLGIRLLYTLTIAGDDNGPYAIGDLQYYHQIANMVADGRGYISPFAAMDGMALPSAEHPPLWPLLLAFESKLGATSVLAHRLAGCFVGAAVIAGIGLLGRRVAGDRAGLLAAAVAAAYPVLIAADGSLMSETLYGLGVVLVLLAAYALRDRRTRWRAALFGAAVGAAALGRPEVLLLIPLLAVPLVWRAGAGRVAPLAIVCVAAGLVLAPWTIRNAHALHHFVLVSTNDGTVIRGANCRDTYFGATIGFWTPGCVPRPHSRNEAVMAREFRSGGFEYMRDHLARLPVVMLVRELRTWDLYGPRWQLLFAEGRNRRVEEAGIPVFFVLAALAFQGALLLRRRGEPVWILASPFVLVALMSPLTYGYTRFRHVAEIPLVVLAAVCLDALVTRRAGRPIDLPTAS